MLEELFAVLSPDELAPDPELVQQPSHQFILGSAHDLLRVAGSQHLNIPGRPAGLVKAVAADDALGLLPGHRLTMGELI